jgi:hypothetical protein
MNASEQIEKKILVFGDSHSVIWSGSDILGKKRNLFKGVDVHHLGPALAYNLLDDTGTTPGKWGEQIIQIISNSLKSDISYIILCFGEIDIRTQAIKRAVSADSTILKSAQEIATRITKFACLLEQQFNIPILIWEPVPSSSDLNFSFNPQFPAVGSEIERNVATYEVALKLRSETRRLQKQYKAVYSFGAYEKLTDFHETKIEYFSDGCHLNLAGLKVALTELSALDDKYKLNVSSFFQTEVFSHNTPKIYEVSRSVQLSLSSKFTDMNSLQKTGRGFCFHTNLEEKPWALVDLGYSMLIESIEISNRIDSEQERASSLIISIGNDPNNMKSIYNFSNQSLLSSDPNFFRLRLSSQPIRYLAFSLNEKNFLHLGWVKIYANKFF